MQPDILAACGQGKPLVLQGVFAHSDFRAVGCVKPHRRGLPLVLGLLFALRRRIFDHASLGQHAAHVAQIVLVFAAFKADQRFLKQTDFSQRFFLLFGSQAGCGARFLVALEIALRVLRGRQAHVQGNIQRAAGVIIGQRYLLRAARHQMQLRGEQFAHHSVILHPVGVEQLFLLQGQLFLAPFQMRFDQPAQAGGALLHAVAAVAAVVVFLQRGGQAACRPLTICRIGQVQEGKHIGGQTVFIQQQHRRAHLGQAR